MQKAGTPTECVTHECFAAAAKECKPAHYHWAFYTVEGTPAFIDFFVLTDSPPSRCVVLTLADYTEDYWGRCTLKKHVCPSLEAAESDAPEKMGCSGPELLMRVEPCKMPE